MRRGRKKKEETLLLKKVHTYEALGREKKSLEKLCKEYIDFLSEIKTERESVEFGINVLKENGYEEMGYPKGYFVYKNKFLPLQPQIRNSLFQRMAR